MNSSVYLEKEKKKKRCLKVAFPAVCICCIINKTGMWGKRSVTPWSNLLLAKCQWQNVSDTMSWPFSGKCQWQNVSDTMSQPFSGKMSVTPWANLFFWQNVSYIMSQPFSGIMRVTPWANLFWHNISYTMSQPFSGIMGWLGSKHQLITNWHDVSCKLYHEPTLFQQNVSCTVSWPFFLALCKIHHEPTFSGISYTMSWPFSGIM